MAQVVFQYKETNTIIKCQEGQKMIDICSNFIKESKINENEIDYFYGGHGGAQFNKDFTFEQMANSIDKKRKKMNVVVMDKEEADKDKSIVKSKDIICPECNQNIMMDINKFKINLFDCKNLHKVDNILLNEFEKTQMINLSNIVCDKCKTQNKSNAAAFFLCYTCNIKLCSTCKENHDNSHNIINYDKANYNCSKHNKPFTSYCKTCKIDLCRLCEESHIKHEIILFESIKLYKNELLRKLREFNRYKDIFYLDIDKIIELLYNVKGNVGNYYKLEEYIINNYDDNEINYEKLYNINSLIKSNESLTDILKSINNENKVEKKFETILKLNTQNSLTRNNEIKLVLDIKKDDIGQNIYFLDNTDGDLYIKGKWEKHSHDFLKELNETNVELYINNTNCKYSKYFIPLKEGIYEIKLVFNFILKDFSFMFYNCTNITNIDLSLLETKKVIDIGGMFYGCSKLTSIDLSSFDTKNITNMGGMFYKCSNLKNIDLSSFNTKNVTDMGGMFLGCSNLKSIDLTSFDTKNVTDMNGMFYNCANLESINITSFNTKNVTNMSYMFYKCSNLQNINLSSFDTKNVRDMNGMFYNCSQLKELDLSNFLTKNVSNMSYMFCGCSNLVNMNLSSFDTKNVTNMGGMFDNCSKLSEIKLNKNSFEKIKFYINEDETNIIFS